MNKRELQIKVAGHKYEVVTIDYDINFCGHIKDGLTFEFGNEGCWVIAYKDLVTLMELAAKVRS